MIVKLRTELDLAYKILTQRDQEVNTMKKQAKVQAFNQCNEERIMYMNECMKLQNLLKIYGGSSIRKHFKGYKVTQTVEDAAKLHQAAPEKPLRLRSSEPEPDDQLQNASGGEHLKLKA